MEPINKSAFPEPEPETVQMIETLEEERIREKLSLMREVEQKNDENIRKWSDEHEQGDSGPRGDQGEG